MKRPKYSDDTREQVRAAYVQVDPKIPWDQICKKFKISTSTCARMTVGLPRRKPQTVDTSRSLGTAALYSNIRKLYQQTSPKLTWDQIRAQANCSKSSIERAIKDLPKKRVQAPNGRVPVPKKRGKYNMSSPKRNGSNIAAVNSALMFAHAESGVQQTVLRDVLQQLRVIYPGVRRISIDMEKNQLQVERIEQVVVNGVN
jgi:hypothetical protein